MRGLGDVESRDHEPPACSCLITSLDQDHLLISKESRSNLGKGRVIFSRDIHISMISNMMDQLHDYKLNKLYLYTCGDIQSDSNIHIDEIR